MYGNAYAQKSDSIQPIPHTDTLAHADSIAQAATLAAATKAAADSVAAERAAAAKRLQHWVDETFAAQVQENIIAHPDATVTYTIEQARQKPNYSFEFTILLVLISILAIFKFINPSYFHNTFMAFQKPNLSARSLKEQLSQNSLASLTMDIISCISIGTFIYSVVNYYQIDLKALPVNKYLLYIYIIGGVLLYFLTKFSLLKLHGYIFNIQEEVKNYAYNISLINKVLGVVLIPFSAMIMLNDYNWIQALIIISLFITIILISNTYIRSSSLFKYFLHNSIFQFFLYLCTSEIIPIVLIYTLIRNYTNL